jgi:hypothetical protein
MITEILLKKLWGAEYTIAAKPEPAKPIIEDRRGKEA